MCYQRENSRKSNNIFIIKATEDPRDAKTLIPIKDSLFEYKLTISHTEAYYLIFEDELKKRMFIPIIIFPEKGEINCTLYPMEENYMNKISGGKLNREYYEYIKSFDDLFTNKLRTINNSESNPEVYKLKSEAEAEKDISKLLLLRRRLSEIQSKTLNRDTILKQGIQWRYNYIKRNPTLVSYFLLYRDLQFIRSNKVSIDEIQNGYTILSQRYPSHPYTQIIGTNLNMRKIMIEGRYIDFTAPDLNGNMVKLSDVIKGKYAVIDLWASWCAPCIVSSRSMIPVYEEFKDKGFTICGVAAERNNTDQMKIRIEKDKYPWINLVELDHKNQIWEKYGLSNSGGGVFLVDREGKILAISPTADEVRKILTEKLK